MFFYRILFLSTFLYKVYILAPRHLMIKLFPARESLVSDNPARDGKNDIFFYSVS